MIALEAWSFDMSNFLAGYLGPVALDAHSALLSTCGFMYMSFPLAVSISASIRVGHLLGAGLGNDARRSALTALGGTAVFQLVLCSALLVGRRFVGNFFTNDEDVISLFCAIAPIACIFMNFDGAQSAMAGAFRGMGRQVLVVALNFIGFWVVGLSVGFWATFYAPAPDGSRGLGVGGLWWGLGAGLFCTSAVGSVVLFRTDWNSRAVHVAALHGQEVCDKTAMLESSGET